LSLCARGDRAERWTLSGRYTLFSTNRRALRRRSLSELSPAAAPFRSCEMYGVRSERARQSSTWTRLIPCIDASALVRGATCNDAVDRAGVNQHRRPGACGLRSREWRGTDRQTDTPSSQHTSSDSRRVNQEPGAIRCEELLRGGLGLEPPPAGNSTTTAPPNDSAVSRHASPRRGLVCPGLFGASSAETVASPSCLAAKTSALNSRFDFRF